MLKTWHMCLISHSACATPHLFEPRQPVFRSTWGSTINPGKKHKESESMTKKIEEKKEMSRLMPEKKHILQQQCPSEKSETIRRLFRIWLITTWWRFFFDPNWTITIHGSKSVKHHGFWHPVSTMGNFQNFSHQHFGGMTYQPGTLLSSIFSFDPSKTRSFPTKTRVTWAPGIYTNINIYCIYINSVCIYTHVDSYYTITIIWKLSLTHFVLAVLKQMPIGKTSVVLWQTRWSSEAEARDMGGVAPNFQVKGGVKKMEGSC